VLDAVAIKRLPGDDVGGDADTGGTDAASDAVVADAGSDATHADAADVAPQDASVPDAAGSEDAAEDVQAPVDVTEDAGPVDVATPDVPAPEDIAQPLDTGTVASSEACLALFSALCARLGQCASEVPFGADQLAQLAGQCDDVLADAASDLDDGCTDAAPSFAGMTPADSAACVASYDCGISGISALGQAIYPLYQAYQDGALAGAVPQAADALLDGCK
jgi:hypothetical protein